MMAHPKCFPMFGSGYHVNSLVRRTVHDFSNPIDADSRDILCVPTSKLHGYDFSYEGLLSIWEGVPAFMHASYEAPTTAYGNTLNVADASESYQGRRTASPAVDLQENFFAALSELLDRSDLDVDRWKPVVTTSKLLQRQVALQLTGWNLREEDLMMDIKRSS